MHAFLKNPREKPTTSKEAKEAKQAARKKPNPPWVEKYRPKNVSEVVEQEEVVHVFQKCLEGSDLPNMLLYGPPGTGKTSTILAAARQLFGDLYKERILELNASDERGIQVIREKVKTFAMVTCNSVRPDGKRCPPFKIIILDEADAMTHAAQSALRRTMEKESRTTRFCLICNYVTRIIAPITSRCTKFRFKPLNETNIIETLKTISTKENVSIDDNAFQAIVNIAGGDMRRAITLLQSAFRLTGSSANITEEDILEISGVIPKDEIEKFIEICRSKNFDNLVVFVKTFITNAFSIAQLMDQLNDEIIYREEFSDKQKSLILDKLGECCSKLNDGGSEYLQILSLACVIILAFSK